MVGSGHFVGLNTQRLFLGPTVYYYYDCTLWYCYTSSYLAARQEVMHYIHVRVDVRVPIPLDQTQRQQRRSEYLYWNYSYLEKMRQVVAVISMHGLSFFIWVSHGILILLRWIKLIGLNYKWIHVFFSEVISLLMKNSAAHFFSTSSQDRSDELGIKWKNIYLNVCNC